ncbi:(d)CMP kinase [Sphingomonas solaris]|uniref:Cytidylate kinase n=1 Tax=Alterirhizorhabdus solaris TaxID=2529389 RepID=A0A558R801_9SPHN|nr:(d)CMP kinase [Sphingomonas solaris]TVV75525.1 (d)CMP kinase [Sphingomonas solaris]
MIIAVDGPAASGKGTIARALAKHYGLPHLDTGLLYRAVGLHVLREGADPSIAADALAGCRFSDAMLADPQLRSEAAGAAASVVSAHPAVRAALIERQRAFAARPGGAVLDGRDIGTVIAPHADAKLFVKAAPAVRARRRHEELRGRGLETSFDRVLLDIRERDRRDTLRDHAPMVQADDADLLDTTFMDIEAAIDRALALVEARIRMAAND